MKALLEQLEQELRTVDVADAAQELMPVEAHESVIGVLDDEQRRWHALQVLTFRENRRNIRELQALIDESFINMERAMEWFITCRRTRCRVHALQGLFILSLEKQFPDILNSDVILIRDGWTLVSKPRNRVTRQDILIGIIIADDLANPSGTVH